MPALLADIGGTNARFARLEGEAPGAHITLAVADYPTIEAAIAEALARLGPARTAVLALAGPVTEEPVRFTNSPWEVSSRALEDRFGFVRVRLVNDFLAQAYALPHLVPTDLLPFGGGTRDPAAPMLVLGPGTGLGVAGFLPSAGIAIPAEGGHISLAPTNEREDAVVAGLRSLRGRAEAEQALSGPGIEHLHTVVAKLRGVTALARDAAEVVEADDAVSREAVELFLDLLAGFAGDMALAWGARGGVFLSGGILPRLVGRMDRARFRARFEAKSPLEAWMAGISLALVTHPSPAFLGLAAIARDS